MIKYKYIIEMFDNNLTMVKRDGAINFGEVSFIKSLNKDKLCIVYKVTRKGLKEYDTEKTKTKKRFNTTTVS